MTESTEPGNSPGESAKPPAEPSNQPTTEASEANNSTAETTLPQVDSSLLPIDSSLPHIDNTVPSLPHIDTSMPPDDSGVPSLPPIDTTLPPIDTTLPSTEGLPEAHFTDTEGKPAHTEGSGFEGSGPAPAVSEHDQSQHTSAPVSTSQTPTNGYQYPEQNTQQQPQHVQQPAHQPQSQQQPQYQPQQQWQQQPQPQALPQQPTQQTPQQQPQPQQYQQQPEMYQHPQAGQQMNMQQMDHSGQAQPGHVQQAPIGSPMPSTMPPMPSVGQYMTGYPTNVGQMGTSPNAQMRYQLPGDPNKMLSGGRHKKEVKRRTKTGCLTCRKRRIKCDEGHPICRNCVKSKRECLGYDPVFRATPSTPSAIQPAPNPPPSLVVNPQDPSYPSAPPGYMPATSQPFAPSLSPATSTEQFEYGQAIDPALEGNNANMAAVQNATVEGSFQPPANPGTIVKQVQISDLLALRGIPPPPPHPITALQPGRLEEIQAVFLATYAPAIDKFLETRWFQEKALSHLMANAQLMAEYSALIDAFNDHNLGDPNVIARLESFEASVVWSSMTMCRHVMSVSNGNQQGQDHDLVVASKRLDVIEALITGEYLETNPLRTPPREPPTGTQTLADQINQRSLDLWSAIGHFLTLHDNEASSAKEIDDTLGIVRTLLDTFENRDVIYSIAIARHVGQRWADFPRSLPTMVTTNEKDAGAKLYVAQKFLEQEAGGKGTTQVIKRICGMVVRSWFVSRE